MNLRSKLNTFLSGGVAAVLCLATVGCGGSGGSSGGTNPTANPYAGNYSGEFIDSADTIDPFTMTISSTGAVSGSLDYATPIAFNGTINNSGAGSVTDSNGTFQVTLGASGLSTLGGGIGTPANGVFISLITNPTGLFSGFSGAYAGTVHNTTLGATGIIAMTISTSGTIAGVDLFDVNGTPTLEPIAGTLSQAGALSYTVHGVTVTGNVTLTGTTISGSLQETNGDAATISIHQIGGAD